MSLLTMTMNPDRAKDLNDMMNKLDRWDALIRDYEKKFEIDDISHKMRQAALMAMAPFSRTHHIDRMWRGTASRGRSLRMQEEPLVGPRRKAKAKARVEDRPKARGKAKCYVCGGIGHPARLRPSEGWVRDLEQDAPDGEDTMKTKAVGPRRTTRHSNWDTLAASLV